MTEPLYPRYLINRQIAVFRPRQPLLDWIKAADPEPCDSTLEDIQEDCESFLIPEFDDDEDARRWVLKHWRGLFEHLLFGWYTDPDLWPQKRSPQLMLQWYDLEIHSMVWDLANEPLIIEDWESDDGYGDGTPH